MPQPVTTLSDRLRLGELRDVNCPSRGVLKHVSSLWGVLCLICLQEGTMRFSQLRRRAAGVSEKMLSQTLRQLEEDGFVHRQDFATVPPHVEYSLTAMGHEVSAHVAALTDWIEGNLPAIMEHKHRAMTTSA
ncbi:MAG TPA: helix-turn-helix domain-containing protein [Novosphingobium sp.]|nr:helix-turn-helix domain-containing protein [Novosphingobium sp.]